MAGPGDCSRQLCSAFQDASSISVGPLIIEEWARGLNNNSFKLLNMSPPLHISLAMVSHVVMPAFSEVEKCVLVIQW